MRLAILALLAFATPLAAQQNRRTANDGNVVLDGIPELPERIAQRLNRYQNIRSASFGDWAGEGAGLYVVTRFGDVPQVHHVAGPGAARRQLTFFTEPVSGVSRRPGGTELLFSMDEGGSEFFQLFLLDPATGDARRLTDGTSRNGAAVWSDDGGKLAYQSTRRNGRSNDVWVLHDPGDTTSARLVFQAPDGAFWAASDWSPDGNRLLLVQYVSITDSRIHLLDLETGAVEHVAGGELAPANYAGVSPTFSADGAGIFLATDSEGEFRQLGYLDLETARMTFVSGDIPWDVEGFALSDDGSRGAFVVNENGISALYLMDPAALQYRRVDSLPVGLIGGLSFSPDGRRLAMTLNTARTPSDVFVLELGRTPFAYGALARWTTSEVGGLQTDEFVQPDIIAYATFDAVEGRRRTIPAFIHRPDTTGAHPVIIYIHGGPESQYRPGFSGTFQYWVNELGAAVIAPNVRGSAGYGKSYVKLDNGAKREDSVRDIGALLNWIQAQPDLDPDRIAVYGGSYGGYMVLASLTHYSERLAAGVDIVGISNFVTFLENTQDYRRDLRRPEYGDERDPRMRAFLDSISPNRQAQRIRVPLFVAQGQNDPRVPVTESEQIVRAVRDAGQDVWYMNALNEGHGFRKKENRDLFDQITVLFFERHLIGEREVSRR
jgi:dipeptidyl aminopeptidase/acylaminoacyl peptidase